MIRNPIFQFFPYLKVKLKTLPLMASSFAAALISLSLLGSTAIQADTIDLSLSDSAAKGDYQAKFRPTQTNRNRNRNRQLDALDYGFNLLYRDDDVFVGGASLHVTGKSKATVLRQQTGIGGKLIAFDAGDPNGGALAIGGYIVHNLAAANLLSVRGDMYFAPSIVNFGDAERYFEYNVRLEYKLVEQASVYLGYRNIKVDFENRDFDLDNSGNLGLIMHF